VALRQRSVSQDASAKKVRGASHVVAAAGANAPVVRAAAVSEWKGAKLKPWVTQSWRV